MIIRRQGLNVSECILYNAEESIVFMFSRQTDRYPPSQEATSPLFSVYVLID